MFNIDSIISEFNNKFNEYDQIRLYADSMLKTKLNDSGVMAITSSRVKDKTRLREKIILRQEEKKYQNYKDIENDIVDFVGIRVALYFPNDKNIVDSIIHQHFSVEKIKTFPDEQRSSIEYSRRFPGYCATHYRVYLKDAKTKYSSKVRIEIQVASLLMHAWSEVEHDLVYKQMKGQVSYDEYESLDEINGLVIAGEVSLQRLQRISELRILTESKPFSNHYILASFIYERIPNEYKSRIIMGDIETLFNVFKSLDRLTPKKVINDLRKIDYSDETPIAQQIIDKYSDSNLKTSNYVYKLSVQKNSDDNNLANNELIGDFINCWINLEKTLIKLLPISENINLSSRNISHLLQDQMIVSSEFVYEYNKLRKIRNELVHGVEPPDQTNIKQSIEKMLSLRKQLDKK